MKTLLITLLFLLSCETDNETITGHWAGSMIIGLKEIPIEFYLDQSGNNLSGYFMSGLGSRNIELNSESNYLDQQINLIAIDTAYQMKYIFSGVVNCDKITGTYTMSVCENIYTNNFEIYK